jgi:prolyl-tRNA editing enzyme YbaK/EbsC (Cys-tRNA(Pro) deacylase)
MSSAVLHSESVVRVREALARAGLAPDIVELPGAARTAQAAAGFLGCDVAQIANSLVFRARHTGRALLVMSCGAKRVDVAKLSALANEPVEKADAGFVRRTTGFAIGGVPPLGHANPLTAFVDQSLALQPALWAAAGHPHTVFRLTYEELLRVTQGRAAEIAQ